MIYTSKVFVILLILLGNSQGLPECVDDVYFEYISRIIDKTSVPYGFRIINKTRIPYGVLKIDIPSKNIPHCLQVIQRYSEIRASVSFSLFLFLIYKIFSVISLL